MLGQLTLALILFFFIKFFIFGDPPSADERASDRANVRRQRTLSHAASLRRRSFSDRKRTASSPFVGTRHISGGSGAANILTTSKILEKTYYNVDGHQPESLDWFNVLIAQTIAQLRADALDGDALLSSLNSVMNGPQKPHFLDDIRVTEVSLGEEFPIFSNCRVIPVDENGVVVQNPTTNNRKGTANLNESRLQARMDVDLSDVVTLGIETKLVLNYPKPFVAVLPVALSVSVVRFSGTLSVSFTPSQAPPQPQHTTSSDPEQTPDPTLPGTPNHSPTTLTFTFLDDYRLDLSVHSLIGSRSRLQDVPKIAQLVEQRLHAWFDERCVEPRFQQIILPSLWPRKRNVRGGSGEDVVGEGAGTSQGSGSQPGGGNSVTSPGAQRNDVFEASPTIGAERDEDLLDERYAGRSMNHRRPSSGRRKHSATKVISEEDRLAEAGAEIRNAENRERERQEAARRKREGHGHEGERDRSRDAEGDGMRRRAGGLGLRAQG